jgi:hypothetical protein
MEPSRRRNEAPEAGPETTDTSSAVNKPTAANESEREGRIAKRAYERFEERGREHGRDLEDWLDAEREIAESGSE